MMRNPNTNVVDPDSPGEEGVGGEGSRRGGEEVEEEGRK